MIDESIAHYSITEKIGAGGMGEVWRARDTKLNRDVALKIIPEIFSQDAERMARFTREAQVLASLNHPNIAAIYGTEESNGKRALVLELVEGDDLSQRLKAGPVPIEEALDIARQIAEALEAAHDKGVVHRDLKPANVKLTPDGAVKVLDFGLAKALEGDPAAAVADPSQSLSPTLTQAATRAGVILGTAAYMSPEQAKGKVVDRRTDIFSFGVVLFEMLSRTKTFEGDSISDTLASVLKLDPPWESLPSGTPQPVVELLHRCLEKDPRQRLQSIGEARIALTAATRGATASMTGASMTAAGMVAGAAAPAKAGPGRMAWFASLVVVAVLAGAAAWLLKPAGVPVPTRRYTIHPPDFQASYGRQPSISPDGKRIAYIAGGELWVRDLDKLEPHLMQASTGAHAVSWSQDGSEVAWVADDKLQRAAAAGGPPTVVAELDTGRVDATAWSPDGRIYITPAQGPMYSVPSQGGDPKVAIPLHEGVETDFHTPFVLPDGSAVLYAVHRKEGADTLEAWRNGERKILLRIEGNRIENPGYDPRGYLVWLRRESNAGVWAAPFDAGRLELTGEPFLVDPAGSYPSVAADRTLLYSVGGGSSMRQLVWVSRQGELMGTVGQPREGTMFPELSPDGSLVLVSEDPSENRDIWIVDVERGTRTRATFSDFSEWSATWLDGGNRIAFEHSAGAVRQTWSRAADGTDEPVKMGDFYLPSFRDGVELAIATVRMEETEDDLVIFRPEEDPIELRPFLAGAGGQSRAQINPDGTLVAYSSEESGQEEIYLKKFPGGEGKWQVSVDGGRWPRWSRDGRELYYEKRGPATNLMVVRVTEKPKLSLSAPEKLFDTTDLPDLAFGLGPRVYDVHPDGERFLTIQRVGQDGEEESGLVVVQNWLGERGL